ncbi:MAG: hypothetical protein GKR86_00080 [Ilumatobacter sp.]|nr:hypothetical protein [Ilumatobacter sp.]
MSIVTIALPPGMMRNGTYYDAKDRWHDGNRVRWHNGAMRAIGGWIRARKFDDTDLDPLTNDPDQTIFRDGFSWIDNGGSRYRIFGGNDELKLWAADDSIVDITPAGFVGTPAAPTISTGYGTWLYNRFPYGAARPINPVDTPGIYRWSFDTYGENVICGPSSPIFRGSLYQWDVDIGVGTPATIIPNAPTDVNNFVVTDQRIIMTIGSSVDQRLVRWSDRENITGWTPTQQNYAGDYFLQGTGRLLSIDKVLDQVLILSETDAHIARWLGAPLVYGFTRVGNDCGPWNSSVIYASDRLAMWPGRRTFWLYDGTLKQVQCEVMDFIAENIDFSNIAKAFVIGIPQYTEIWWFFQSIGSSTGEVDMYVSYDYVENHWSKGALDRTGGLNGEVYVNPYMIRGDDQVIFEHDRDDLVVNEAWCETGPLEMGQGEQNMAVRYIYPDVETRGDVNFTLYGQNMPTDDRYVYGPYQFNNPIPTRALGRSLSMRVDGQDVPNWKVGGKNRFDVAPMGTGTR